MALKQVIDVGGQGEAPRSRDIAGSGSAYAKNTNFDPTNTDFESTQLQALGEEIDGSLNTKANKTNLSNYILTGTKPSTALSSGTFFVDKDGALRVATDDIATTDDVGSGNSAVKSVGGVLSELNSNKCNTLMVVSINIYDGSGYPALNPNEEYTYNKNVSKTGYKVLGILGFNTGNASIIASGSVDNIGVANVKYVNAGAVAASYSPIIDVLYVKE